MLVPLADEVSDLLERRKKSSLSVFVFASSKSKTGYLVEPHRSWQDLLKRAEIEDLRLNDLSRTLIKYYLFLNS